MRYWTETEARAELPRVKLLVDVIAQTTFQRRVASTNGHAVSSNGAGTSQAPGGRGAETDEDGIGNDDPVIDVESAVAELAEKGIVLRDPETGLLDFPAITDKGVVYLLCWKRDEEDLGWWHFAEEGFAGRRRLPVPRDL
ncbi:MAG TPA: DUF2203 domain-containing protein [Acidimicrobiales bacterium]|jgi:hypothetical protein|nr:DUF2203 domain-containing protein [Acidimicrobiales bacterium]